MGLKSGSRDAELDDEGDSSEDEEVQESRDEERETRTGETTSKTPEQPTGQSSRTERTDRSQQRQGTDTQETGTQETDRQKSNTEGTDRPTMDQIPYVLRRDKVNEGREQKPFFIRPEVFEEAQLRDDIESMIGEKPPKSDVREASMIAAQRNPELVAEILREWGYDLDQS